MNNKKQIVQMNKFERVANIYVYINIMLCDLLTIFFYIKHTDNPTLISIANHPPNLAYPYFCKI